MPLIQPRQPRHFGFKSSQEAIKVIDLLLQKGDRFIVFDAIAETVEAFPDIATDLLASAWEVYDSMGDLSRYDQYQKRVFDFNVSPGDKVLDIGSGHLPFPLATHLADISLKDGNIGRAGIPFKYQDGKPVFECAVERTPFKDKEFDFVYCSHVLEHSSDPAKACEELMRIAKRGYIETPTKGKDIFLSTAKTSNHLNYVELNDDVLTFYKYQPWEMDGLHNDILLKMHVQPETKREKAFSALIYLFPRHINTMLLWENDFKYKIN